MDDAHRLMVMILDPNAGTSGLGFEREPLGSDQLVKPGRRYQVLFDPIRLDAATARMHTCVRRWAAAVRRTPTHKVYR